MLLCPICHTPLHSHDNTLQCEQHHTFDAAKEGYVNLLRHRVAPTVGDTREMLQARRLFFESGCYQPLADTLTALVIEQLAQAKSVDTYALLDVGCGEGYYLGRLQRALHLQTFSQRPPVQLFGLDVSKEAIRLAAKRYAHGYGHAGHTRHSERDVTIQFLVADVKERLVFADASLHLLLNIFAPRNVEEFARVLVPGGLVLVAIPGTQHLRQLRERLPLLSIQENKPQQIESQFASHFDLFTTTSLRYTLRLTQPEVEQLVVMTPNYWHRSEEMRAGIHELETLDVDIEFVCLLFSRKTSRED